jgi:hypothetical protein
MGSRQVWIERAASSAHSADMGKVIVTIKLTNLKDMFLKSARARRSKPREMQVETLVDSGATRLYLKPSGTGS